MAWPDFNSVTCVGFPKSYLPAIAEAMARKEVKWGKGSLFASSCIAQFDWAGCTWELCENFELVHSVSLLKGTPNSEDLTAAVLVYK